MVSAGNTTLFCSSITRDFTVVRGMIDDSELLFLSKAFFYPLSPLTLTEAQEVGLLISLFQGQIQRDQGNYSRLHSWDVLVRADIKHEPFDTKYCAILMN